MARGLGVDRGGIASLRRLIAEHKEALEYDLIRLGLRLDWLGTPELSWRDLLVLVRQAPESSAIRRALLGDSAGWGLPEHLLARLSDQVANLVWLQTEDGAKGVNRPVPLPRPGVEPVADESRMGGRAVDLIDMAEWLAKRNPNQHRREGGPS
ncbi:DUF5361 domain-containing protein [Nocardioides terrisoli]|uniref:DUF5361 domain-containing protein n=1 Tax=Nocardioides terrisoli TaxID=3388267 RepID=UPI00287BC96B|nr:DUF5361 domain-containing protein [Nocardioides marmorisolisilvae]